jgi:hypothetical protein
MQIKLKCKGQNHEEARAECRKVINFPVQIIPLDKIYFLKEFQKQMKYPPFNLSSLALKIQVVEYPTRAK